MIKSIFIHGGSTEVATDVIWNAASHSSSDLANRIRQFVHFYLLVVESETFQFLKGASPPLGPPKGAKPPFNPLQQTQDAPNDRRTKADIGGSKVFGFPIGSLRIF